MEKREGGGGGGGRGGEKRENWGRQSRERRGQLRTTEEGGKTGNTELGKSPPPPTP